MRIYNRYLLIIIFIVAIAALAGCGIRASGSEGENSEEAGHVEGSGHDSGGSEEESGQTYALDDVHDAVRNGAQLRIAYDAEKAAFKGTVGNITDQTLCRVRVEVHLSNGTELSPTTPVDLAPGEQMIIELPTDGETFESWSTHPETSPCSASEWGSGEGTGEGGHTSEGDHDEGGEHSEGSGD